MLVKVATQLLGLDLCPEVILGLGLCQEISFGSSGWDADRLARDLAPTLLGLGLAPKVLGVRGLAPQSFRDGEGWLLSYLGPQEANV